MASSAVATASDGTQHEGHILRLGVDLGTGHLSIDGQHIQGDHSCDPFALLLKNRFGGSESIKQIAIHEENSNVIYGFEDVTEAVRTDPELRDWEIERFKLALHPEFADLSEVKHVKEILGAKRDRGAIQIFYTDLFRTILKDVRALYLRFYKAGMDEGYWSSIPIELQISVPAMWDDTARGVIRNAARNGGATRAELREEPLCIATPHMVHMVKDRNIKVGQCLLLIDCGQGTLDIATVKLIREPSAGHLMELQRIGNCSGNGAGSHKVNTAAEKWLLSGKCTEIKSHGGFDETYRKLGMSERQFLRAFSDAIDTVKIDIDKQSVFDVRIYGLHGEAKPGSLYQLTITIPRATLMLWYTTWTTLTKKLLGDHLSAQSAQSGKSSEQFAWALFTGGGANSPEFCTQMETVLEEYKILVGRPQPCISACSSGALLQHHFQQDGLPPNAHFHISQTEYYNGRIHPHARSDGLVFRSEFEHDKEVVYDRLVTVGRSSDQQDFTSEGYFPQMFYVEADNKLARLHFDLFWSEEPLRQHCALVNAKDVRSYPLMFIDPDHFSKHGFKVLYGEVNQGKPHFIVKGFLKMESTKDSLLLRAILMKQVYVFPEKCLPQQGAKKKKRIDELDEPPFDDDEVLIEFVDEVWHKDCSHFISSNSGISRPHSQATHQGGVVANAATRRSGRQAGSGANE
jgi:hypothetical protein